MYICVYIDIDIGAISIGSNVFISISFFLSVFFSFCLANEDYAVLERVVIGE